MESIRYYEIAKGHDILFNEKIDGSLHFALGNCYDDAYNGNHSDIHWDKVSIQRPDFGGGEIWLMTD